MFPIHTLLADITQSIFHNTGVAKMVPSGWTRKSPSSQHGQELWELESVMSCGHHVGYCCHKITLDPFLNISLIERKVIEAELAPVVKLQQSLTPFYTALPYILL